MDTQKLHIDNENTIDEAFQPLRCFSSALCELNVQDAAVHPTSIGVALQALIEKCAADLILAMDTAGQAHTSDA